MATSLIIQVLTEEDAKTLNNKIFRNLAEMVKGTYSGTYGLMIPFEDWNSYAHSSTVSKFLYGEPKIELKPSELMYYEFSRTWNRCEEVGFYELYPTIGIYRFDKEGTMQIEPTSRRILYKGKHVCRIDEVYKVKKFIEENNDPLIKSGISKIYRRGFIDNKAILFEWINVLIDILEF